MRGTAPIADCPGTWVSSRLEQLAGVLTLKIVINNENSHVPIMLSSSAICEHRSLIHAHVARSILLTARGTLDLRNLTQNIFLVLQTKGGPLPCGTQRKLPGRLPADN
jgi:hypothetical protein